ncbi:hypothetical protein FHS86_002302 [Roseimarinus sediminis]
MYGQEKLASSPKIGNEGFASLRYDEIKVLLLN